MTLAEWTPDISGHTGPKADAIADAICDAIRAGTLKPGDRLPPHRELAWRLNVSVGTVTRAYAETQRRGVLAGRVGSGTYVREDTPPAQRFALDPVPDGMIDLSTSYATCPLRQEALARVMARFAGEAPSSQLLEYGPAAGSARHREAGARWMAIGDFRPDPERVLVTAGAQQALSIVFSALSRPGDAVLCEALLFPPVITLATSLGLKLHGLPMDADGLLPDALDAAARATGARMLYTIPNLQNPTGAIMSEARRREIARIARARDLLIVEDDVFAKLLEPPPPLATFAPERTWYVTSVSKTLAPGLRVGYVAAPDDAIAPLVTRMRAFAWMTSSMAAEIATVAMEDGIAEEMVAWHRRERHARAALARDICGKLAANPNDSLHLWFEPPAPWRAEELVGEFARRGVRVAAGDAFVASREGGCNGLRISLNAPASRERLAEALQIVADTMRLASPARASIL